MTELLPIPLALSEGRLALTRMYIDLTVAFHATILPVGHAPTEIDADLTVVAVTVMLGHAMGQPMTASEIADHAHMPRQSVQRRLNALVEHGLIVRIEDQYYLEPDRAKNVPHRDTFELILAKGFAGLGYQ